MKSSTYYHELGKMVANTTLVEDDTNIESIHKEIESTENEVKREGEVSGEGA